MRAAAAAIPSLAAATSSIWSAASTRPPGNTCAPPMNAMLSLRRTRKTSNGCAGRSRTTVDAGRATTALIDSVYSEFPGDAAKLNPVSYEDLRRRGRSDADGRRERARPGAGFLSTQLPRTGAPLDARRADARRSAAGAARAPHEPRVPRALRASRVRQERLRRARDRRGGGRLARDPHDAASVGGCRAPLRPSRELPRRWPSHRRHLTLRLSDARGAQHA